MDRVENAVSDLMKEAQPGGIRRVAEWLEQEVLPALRKEPDGAGKRAAEGLRD